MSASSVDNRIVEMSFENQLFEKNVNTSINTLEKLREALDLGDAAKGFDQIEKASNSLSFDKLAYTVDSLSDKFSAFGIVGMTVIQRLTNAAIDLGMTLANKVMGPITSGGWNRATNIDQAKFKLEGLNVAWNDIEKDINYGVKDTAYGLDAAASAASQLVASGVKFGETFGDTGSSPMAKALRGISGVAAMTSSTYEEISNIFTTVAGQGKLMTIQLRMLEGRGLNAAAKLGEAMGKSEAEIREMVTKGEIDFKEFSEAMDQLFGEHAKEANRTFEGSMANMKSALGRIGAEFAGPFRASAIGVFNSLRNIFDLIKKQKLGVLFEDATEFMGNASRFLINIIDNLDLSWLDWIIDKIHMAYLFFDTIATKLVDGWDAVKQAVKPVSDTVDKILLTEEKIKELANEVIRGDYGNGEERVEKLGDKYEIIQNKVNELLGCTFRYTLSAEQQAMVEEGLATATQGTADATKNATDAAKKQEKAIVSLRDASRDQQAHEHKQWLQRRQMEQMTEKLVDTLAKYVIGFKTLGKVVDAVVAGAIEPLKQIGITLGSWFLDGAAHVADLVLEFSKWMEESGAYEKIQNAVNSALTKFANILETVKSVGDKAFSVVTHGIELFASVISQAKLQFDRFYKKFSQTKSFKRIAKGFSTVKQSILGVKDKALKVLNNGIEKFLGLKIKLPTIDTSKLAIGLDKALTWILDKIDAAKEAIKNFFSLGNEEGEKGGPFAGVVTFFKKFSWAETIDKIKGKIESLGGAIQEFYEEVKETSLQEVLSEKFEIIKQKIIELKDRVIAKFKEYWLNFFGEEFELPTIDPESFTTTVKNIYDWVMDKIGKIKEKFLGLFSVGDENGEGRGIFAGITEFFDSLGVLDAIERVRTFFDGLRELFTLPEIDTTPLTNSIDEAVNWITDKFTSLKNFIVGLFTGGEGEEGKTPFESVLGFFNGSSLSGVLDKLGTIKGSIIDVKDKALGALSKAWGDFFGQDFKFPTIDFTPITGKVTEATGWVTEKFETVKSRVSNLFSSGKLKVEGMFSGVTEFFEGLPVLETIEKVKGFFTNLKEQFKLPEVDTAPLTNSVDKAVTWVTNKFDTVKSFITGLFPSGEEVKIPFENILGYFNGSKLTGLIEKLGSVKDKVIDVKDNAVGALSKAWSDFFNQDFKFPAIDFTPISKKASEVTGWVTEKFETVKSHVSNLFSSGKLKVEGMFSGVTEFFEGLPVLETIEKVKGFFTSLKEQFKLPEVDTTPLTNSVDKAVTWVTDKFETVKSVISGVFSGDNKDGKGGLFSGIIDFFGNFSFSDAKKSIKSAFTNIGKTATSKGSSVLTTIQNVAKEALSILPGFGTTVQEAVQDNFETAGKSVSALKGKTEQLTEAVKNTTVWQKLGGALTAVKEKAISLKDTAIQKLREGLQVRFGLPEIDGSSFISSVSNAVEWVKSKFKALKDWLFGLFDSGSQEGHERGIFGFIGEFIENFSATEAYDDFVEWIKGVKDNVLEFVSSLGQTGLEKLINLGTAITELAQSIGGFVGNIAGSAFETFMEFLDSLKKKDDKGLFDNLPSLDEVIAFLRDLVGKLKPLLFDAFEIFRSYNLIKLIHGIAQFVSGPGSIMTGVGWVLRGNAMKYYATAFTSIAEGIAKIAYAMMMLGFLSDSQMKNAQIGIITLSACLAGLLIAWGFMKRLWTGTSFINAATNPVAYLLSSIQAALKTFLRLAGIAALIAAIAYAVKTLVETIELLAGLPDVGKIWNAVAVIGVLLLVLGGIVKLMSLGTGTSFLSLRGAVTIVAMAYAVKLLADAVITLSEYRGKLFGAVASVIGLVVALGVAAHLSAGMGHGIFTLIGLMLLIAELVAAVIVLSKIPEKTLMNTAKSLGLVMAALAAVIFATSRIKLTASGFLGSLLTFTAMGLLLAGLYELFYHMQSFDADAMLKQAEALALVIATVTGLTVAARLIGTGGAGSLVSTVFGTLAFDIVFADVIALVAMLGELRDFLEEKKITTLEKDIESGFKVLEELAEGVGACIGRFFEGLIWDPVTDMSSDLPGVGEDLNKFLDELKKFSDRLKNGEVDLTEFQSFVDMVEKLFTVANDNFYANQVNTTENRVLVQLFVDLIEVAGLAKEYAETIKGLDTETLNETTTPVQALTTIGAGLGDVTIQDKLTGNTKKLKEFASQLPAFAKGMVEYTKIMKGGFLIGPGFQSDVVTSTEQAVAIVTSLAAEGADIQTTGGVLGIINQFTTLEKGLSSFAQGLVAYTRIMDDSTGHGFRTGVVTATNEAVDIALALAKEGADMNIGQTSLWSWLSGSGGNQLTNFGTGMKNFAVGLVAFSQEMIGFRTSTKKKVDAVLPFLTDLVAIVPTESSLFDKLFGEGDNGLGNFGDNIAEFGQGLRRFSEEINGTDGAPNLDLTKSIESLNQVKEVTDLFNEINDKAKEWSSGEAYTLISTMSRDVEGFVETIAAEFDENGEAVGKAKSFGELILEKIIGLTANNYGNLTRGATSEIKSGGVDLGSFGERIAAVIGNSLGEKAVESKELVDGANKLAKALADDIHKAIDTEKEPVVDAFNKVIGDLLSTLLLSTVLFEASVAYIAGKLKTKIQGYKSSFTTVASSICGSMVSAIRGYYNSFYRAGEYAMDGLAAGIAAGKPKVITASSTTSSEAVKTVKKEFDENSPSKVFRKIGYYGSVGLGDGFVDGIPYVTSSVTNLTDNTLGAVSDSLSNISDSSSEQAETIYENLKKTFMFISAAISNAMDIEPTVRPVVDLSEIQNGVHRIDNMVGSGYAIGASGLRYAGGLFGSAAYNSRGAIMDANVSVIDAIKSIRSDLAYLGESITTMQMVLDSGVLVGSIGSGMDGQLGHIQKLKERWA